MSVIVETGVPTRVRTRARADVPGPRSERFLQIYLLAFFCLLYLLTANGRLVNRDAESVFQVARSLVEHHSFAVPEASVFTTAVGPRGTDVDSLSFATETARIGLDGRPYSMYGIGQSLAAAPLYLLGRVLQPLSGVDLAVIGRLAVSLLNALVTALTALLLYRCGRMLSYSVRSSLLVAAGYGLSTMAWPYAKSFAGEPLTGALLLLGFFAVERALAQTNASRGCWLFLSGAAHGAALLVRISSGIALPVAGVYLLWHLVDARRHGEVSAARILQRMLLWAGPAVAGMAGVALYNLVRFGDPTITGYQSIGWSVPPQVGLYGLLLSPGKGIFWYNPLLLASLIGLVLMLARRRGPAVYILGLSLVWIAFHSPYRFWEGGWSWGPRLLLPIVPFLILPLGELFYPSRWSVVLARAPHGMRARCLPLLATVGRRAVPLLLAVGLLVQILAVGADYTRYLWATSQQYPADAYARLIYQPTGSPLLWQPVALLEVMSNVTRPGGLGEMREDMAERERQHERDGLDEEAHAVAVLDDTMVVGLNVPDFWFVLLPIFGASLPIVAAVLSLLVVLLTAAAIGLRGQLGVVADPDPNPGRVAA